MTIPKIIHYCWFGGDTKPEYIKEFIRNWHVVLKDYEIIEWNESNFDYKINKFASEMYDNKKYGFTSDYFRFKTLYEYGGIYLDADIDVQKPFDDLLGSEMVMGFMFNSTLGTAVIGAERHNEIIKKILTMYEDENTNFRVSNNMITEFFLENFKDFKLIGEYQKLSNGLTIYPKEYFEKATYNSNMGYSVHHSMGSWYNKKNNIIKKIARKMLGIVIYGKISHYYSLRISPYYRVYLDHKKRK